MNRTAAATLVVALSLVIAGCSAPATVDDTEPTVETPSSTASDEATTTPTDGTATPSTDDAAVTTTDPELVRVRGGTVEPDAERVYRRVAELVDADPEPATVVVKDGQGRPIPDEDSSGRTIAGTLGWSTRSNVTAGSSGYYDPRDDEVVVYPAGHESPADLERTLAHEYAHLFQYRTGGTETLAGSYSEFRYARRAVTEGVAVFVAQAYVDRYGGKEERYTSLEYIDTENMTQDEIWAQAPYVFGYRYVDQRIDDPANVSRIYEDPPRSMEAVMHPGEPAEPRPFDVRVTSADGEWYDAPGHRPVTMGEHTLWTTLLTELDNETAWRAASGWGNDTLVRVRNQAQSEGFAWALRMDSERDADELEAAIETYMERRSDRVADGVYHDGDTALRFVRTSPESGVLLLGNDSFVAKAVVNGTNDSATVELGRIDDPAAAVAVGGDERLAGARSPVAARPTPVRYS